MKNIIVIITIIIVANIICFGPIDCNAQLGGEAPLPEIKKFTGPSLEETKKWITNKFESLPIFSVWEPVCDKVDLHYVVSFDDCEMKVAFVKSCYKDPTLHITYLKLQEMDAENSDITKYTSSSMLQLKSIGSLKVVVDLSLSHVNFQNKEVMNRVPANRSSVDINKEISYKISVTDPLNDVVRLEPHWVFKSHWYPQNYLWLHFKEIETAESMSNAFKHAIKLCQQKAADEKAAQPPKKRDLF